MCSAVLGKCLAYDLCSDSCMSMRYEAIICCDWLTLTTHGPHQLCCLRLTRVMVCVFAEIDSTSIPVDSMYDARNQ